MSHHVWLRAAVVRGELDGSLLLGLQHPGTVAGHVLHGQLVGAGEGCEVDVPGVMYPGAQLDMAGLGLSRVPGAKWDKSLWGRFKKFMLGMLVDFSLKWVDGASLV